MNILSAPFHVQLTDWQHDRVRLQAVRDTVFIVEQRVPLELERDALDARCEHVLAGNADGQPIGAGRLSPQHDIGRMAVLKHWRGRGVGTAMLEALIARARIHGWTDINLHAQISALEFYRAFGFQTRGERFMEAGIEHQSMSLLLTPT